MKLIKFIPLLMFFVFFALDATGVAHSFPYFWIGAMFSLMVFGISMPTQFKGTKLGNDWSQNQFSKQEINPSTGLPMIGGCDAAGNAYGCGNSISPISTSSSFDRY